MPPILLNKTALMKTLTLNVLIYRDENVPLFGKFPFFEPKITKTKCSGF